MEDVIIRGLEIGKVFDEPKSESAGTAKTKSTGTIASDTENKGDTYVKPFQLVWDIG